MFFSVQPVLSEPDYHVSENFLFRNLWPHAFPYQIEVICHLAKRKQLLYPAQFALFES